MHPYHAAVHAARLMLGVLFVVSALEGLYFVASGVALFSWPMTAPTEAFMRALQSSGFFWPYLKGLEFIGGVLLLSNRYVALGVALLIPIIATIVLMQVAINLPGGLPYAVGLAGLSGLLLWAYRDAFAGLLAAHRAPAGPAGRRQRIA